MFEYIAQAAKSLKAGPITAVLEKVKTIGMVLEASKTAEGQNSARANNRVI